MSDKRQTRSKTEDKEKGSHWTGFGISAFTASVSLVAAGVSAYSASQASRQVDLLERHKIEREGQFKVYERVETQLANAQPYNLVIASAYVQLIEDAAIRRALCETIGSIAFSQLASSTVATDRSRLEAALRDVVRVARDCSEAMELGRTSSSNAQGTEESEQIASATASAVQNRATEEAPVARVVSSAGTSTTGWDVDVFSCQGQGDRSRELAARTANHLAMISNGNQQLAGEHLGRVRLRSVSPALQDSLVPAGGNRVFGAADEESFARAVVAELNRRLPGANFTYGRTNRVTRWYISVFPCGFPAGG